MSNRVAVVFYSQYGNTREVSTAIADAIQEFMSDDSTVQLVEMDALSSESLANADLVLVGAPTHNMNLPEDVSGRLDALPRGVLKGKACAAFDTSYEMSRWLRRFTASRRLAKRLKKLGGKVVVAPESFLIEHHHEGPLLEGELDRARTWALTVLQQQEVVFSQTDPQ